MTGDVFSLTRGTAPLIVSLPHVGTFIPDTVKAAYVPRALAVEDTDWHLQALYAFAAVLGASVIAATHSRYVIDLNRPPDDAPMYPGASNTELCPTKFFTGDALYREGLAPSAAEIDRRRIRYWWPYHLALKTEIDRLRAQHGYVIHWDGHSIRSRIPWLFEGKLRDLNLGTADGKSCAPSLRAALSEVMEKQSDYSYVVDGRFKGGYTTRHYGRPSEYVHTVQMEMCQLTYMDESPPFNFDMERASRAEIMLRALLIAALRWQPNDSERGERR